MTTFKFLHESLLLLEYWSDFSESILIFPGYDCLPVSLTFLISQKFVVFILYSEH